MKFKEIPVGFGDKFGSEISAGHQFSGKTSGYGKKLD